MLSLLLLLLPLDAHAKKPKAPKAGKAPTTEVAAEKPKNEKAKSDEPAWADAPLDDWLPKDGPVRGRMGATTVTMPRVALSFHVAPTDSTELTTTATMYLEQLFYDAVGDSLGGNQVWLDLPTSLSVGIFRSEAPARPPFAQLSTAPDGSDARNWQSSEAVWVLELTSWDVKVPEVPPAEETKIGTASGRVAVMLRDSWGGTDTGFVAGTFTDIEVWAQAAGW